MNASTFAVRALSHTLAKYDQALAAWLAWFNEARAKLGNATFEKAMTIICDQQTGDMLSDALRSLGVLVVQRAKVEADLAQLS